MQIRIFELIFILMIISTSFICAQSNTDSSKYLSFVDVNPEFPGGDSELYCFYDKNINKELLKSISKAGVIIAAFIVNESGIITDVKIIKSIDANADNELVRIIKLMPKWKPGQYRRKIVPVQMNLPLKLPYVNYCLSEK